MVEAPVVEAVLGQAEVSNNRPSFQFEARVIMAAMTNLAFALNGHGDWDFAQGQLERIHEFLWVVD